VQNGDPPDGDASAARLEHRDRRKRRQCSSAKRRFDVLIGSISRSCVS
jgi:hypothetical protein